MLVAPLQDTRRPDYSHGTHQSRSRLVACRPTLAIRAFRPVDNLGYHDPASLSSGLGGGGGPAAPTPLPLSPPLPLTALLDGIASIPWLQWGGMGFHGLSGEGRPVPPGMVCMCAFAGPMRSGGRSLPHKRREFVEWVPFFPAMGPIFHIGSPVSRNCL
jgi:hypothetical protein